MDYELEIKLLNYKQIILNYLLSSSNIIKFNNNEKFRVNYKFKPLLLGDWSRISNCDKTKINLSVILNTKITKNDLFLLVFNELTRKPLCKTDYNKNFNPNLFFLFFDDFYNNGVKFSKNNYGIQFINEQKYRKEIIKIIEIHSYFVLNNNLFVLLTENKFIEYFIEKSFIQYQIKINQFNYYKYDLTYRYVDLCYIIEDKELMLEINEYHHNLMNDKKREIEILLETGSRIVNYDLNNFFVTSLTIYENMIKSLCKILFKNNNEMVALKIYLVEINKLDIGFVNIFVDINYKKNSLYLKDLYKLPTLDKFNINIKLNQLIKIAYERNNIDFTRVFTNSKKILDYDEIIESKSELILSPFGIKTFLMSIDGIYWTKRNDFIAYIDKFEKNYYLAIKKILNDDTEQELKKECNILKSYFNLSNFNYKIFFDKYGHDSDNLLHDKLPFIIKSEGDYVNYNYLKLFIGNKENEYNDNYIINYRLLTLEELKNIYL
jgi:hypothetical protein